MKGLHQLNEILYFAKPGRLSKDASVPPCNRVGLGEPAEGMKKYTIPVLEGIPSAVN